MGDPSGNGSGMMNMLSSMMTTMGITAASQGDTSTGIPAALIGMQSQGNYGNFPDFNQQPTQIASADPSAQLFADPNAGQDPIAGYSVTSDPNAWQKMNPGFQDPNQQQQQAAMYQALGQTAAALLPYLIGQNKPYYGHQAPAVHLPGGSGAPINFGVGMQQPSMLNYRGLLR